MIRPAVGVIGLGIMGSAMSANLARSGFKVHGYDVAPAQLDVFRQAGGHPARSAAEVAEKAEIVISSLPSAEALHAVASELTARCIVIETSTLPLEDKNRAFKTLEAKGITLLDCPLSGTGAQARTKDLTVYASGDQAAFEQTKPVLEGFSRAHYYLGEFGNGSKMKYVANLLVAIHNVASAEAMVLGMKAGLDPRTIFEMISNGAGNSRVFELRAPMMVKNDYSAATMKIKVWDKDMDVIGKYAKALRVPTPTFAATIPVYAKAEAMGLAMEDTAAVSCSPYPVESAAR